MTPYVIMLGLLALWLLKQVIGTLISQQIRGSIPDYTARKAVVAARRLPDHLVDEYEANWLAELETLERRPISALRFAHGLAKASRSISALGDERCRKRQWWLVLNRAFDIAGGLLSLVALAPLLSAISLVSKLSRPGYPVLHRRPRLGKGGKPIFLLSFRTTTNQADRFAIGDFLRRTSLAYLPTFINLLRGDISLVGPPPQVADSSPEDQVRPLSVRPGLASWQWLAESGGVTLSVEEACARDAQRSFRNDVVLLATQWTLTLRGHKFAPTDASDDDRPGGSC